MKHEVGRELVYDLFFLLAKNIVDVPITANINQECLTSLLSDIEVLHKIVKNVCRTVVQHEKIKHEDGRDFFTLKQWKELHSRVKNDKFIKEREAIERGRSFATAYRTPMGIEISEGMLRCIQTGYEEISNVSINMKGIYEMNVYRTISLRWEAKILAYKTNIERVRKIIYKEN